MLSGTIVAWSGIKASIPNGFFVCDGNNGTPNLTSKFVIGAGGSFAVGDNAGIVTHGHAYTTDFHSHDIIAGSGILMGAPIQPEVSSNFETGITNTDAARAPFFNLFFIMVGF